MAGLLAQIRSINRLGDLGFAEPFAGGAGAALTMLYLEEASEIEINDADRAIHGFWWSILHQSREFLRMLDSTPVAIDEWKKQRAVYRQRRAPRLQRGFAAFYLNRCNRSGVIINGGPIGGFHQSGAWTLDVRFNKLDLRRRCEKVAEYRGRIRLSCLDALEFIALQGSAQSPAFLFIDPPYFANDTVLYLDELDEDYHAKLASRLRDMCDSPWVLTYDDCAGVRSLYEEWATIRPFGVQYADTGRKVTQSAGQKLTHPRQERV